MAESASATIAAAAEVSHVERTGAHSHIHGLGLDSSLAVVSGSSCGLVGQAKARRSCGVIVRLVKEGQLGGRAVLLAGAPGTGKTALAMAMAQELGHEAPFAAVAAAELFSASIGKSEALTQALRRAIAVEITEETEVIEGEVVEVIVDETSLGKAGGRTGRLTLKTTDMEAAYDLGAKMLDALTAAKVAAGDVIRIDKSTGKVVRLGRAKSRERDFEITAGGNGGTSYVRCPSGELQQRRKVEHSLTLHEIDVVNSRARGFLALFSGDTGEIAPDIRSQVDARVAEWVQEGKARAVPGVLFVDEAHVLDLECFAFLNTALDAQWAPLVVLATNRGSTAIRGTKLVSPHGIPRDFLDRLLIVMTAPYSAEDIRNILLVRAREEDVELESTALDLLGMIAQETSLRYAMQLITTASLVAAKRNASKVSTDDVSKCYELFVDIKRSTEYLAEYNEETSPDETDKNGMRD